MTIASTTSRWAYTANGTSTNFSYTGKIFASTELVVHLVDTAGTETLQTLGVDYTVSGVGNNSGGSVVFSAAPTAGYRVIIRRIVNLTQPTSFRNQGAFFPELHEDSFDRLVMMIQQVNDLAQRAFRTSDIDGDNFDVGGVKIRGLADGTAVDDAATFGQVFALSAALNAINAAQITSGTLSVARIPALSADQTVAGTFGVDRIPNLPASKTNSGTFANARISQSSVTQYQGQLSISRRQLTHSVDSFVITAGAYEDLGLPTTRSLILMQPSGSPVVRSIEKAALTPDVITLVNVGSSALLLADEVSAGMPGGSTAEYRMLLTDTAGISVPVRGSVQLWYDSAALRWRQISI